MRRIANVIVITPQTEPMVINVFIVYPPENSDTVSLCEHWSVHKEECKRCSNPCAQYVMRPGSCSLRKNSVGLGLVTAKIMSGLGAWAAAAQFARGPMPFRSFQPAETARYWHSALGHTTQWAYNSLSFKSRL